jgi:hypothetical protein
MFSAICLCLWQAGTATRENQIKYSMFPSTLKLLVLCFVFMRRSNIENLSLFRTSRFPNE